MPNKKTSGPDYLDYTGQEELNEKLRKRRLQKKKAEKMHEDMIERGIKKMLKSKKSSTD